MKLNNAYAYISIALLGMLSIVLPVFFVAKLNPYESPLFPIIRTGIEGISMYSLSFLFLSGFIITMFSKPAFWKLGLMSMALFPIATFSEIIYDSSSHTMFPIEFIFYGIYSIPAIIGAYIAQLLKINSLKKK